ncbi:nuclear transport factor 2 family protein [Iodobacter fluviatilis]|jgi:ketosteroid isomerase-like protein|uniref:Nuclear transport factor 2 family protein n=1 Tax=Iodobacter fluviatilis TaxID=537 RepID=A0A7G3GDS4_9NEIS|nr:nuclear transport factor 2 family protein [Iodobacter fluviatilis]QBC44835.1 nuclear transport factor 2 family protein [Iodobacter fluviatilis]
MTKLTALLDWYSQISPQTLPQLGQFYALDARFKDPFNDVQGVAAIEAIFSHMFATTDNPHFIIAERIEQGQQAFITWVFEFNLQGKPYHVSGGSHLVFNMDGDVTLHRDYWDAAEELLQKLPIVGVPIRWLRRQFKCQQSELFADK